MPLNNSKGFSLIEILIALALAGVVLGLVFSNNGGDQLKLDETVKDLTRAINFMGDEAALKNRVTRVHFKLGKEPQEWALEFGPSENFVLPAKKEESAQVESDEEAEKRKNEEKQFENNFGKVTDFNEKNFEIDENIKIVGVGTMLQDTLMTQGETSIYAFPSGEKDESIIFITNFNDVISLKVRPFLGGVETRTFSLKERKEEDLENQIKGLVEEEYQKWKKEH